MKSGPPQVAGTVGGGKATAVGGVFLVALESLVETLVVSCFGNSPFIFAAGTQFPSEPRRTSVFRRIFPEDASFFNLAAGSGPNVLPLCFTNQSWAISDFLRCS